MIVRYLCGTDYYFEMGLGIADFYDTVEKCKEGKSKCFQECGIVEIELDEAGNEIGHKWIQDPEM